MAQAQSDSVIAQTMMPRGAAERRKCLNMEGFKRLICLYQFRKLAQAKSLRGSRSRELQDILKEIQTKHRAVTAIPEMERLRPL